MAGNFRFEVTSSSPEGSQYISSVSNGHRGHAPGGSIVDRSVNFREPHEGRTQPLCAGSFTPSGGAGSVSCSGASHGDLLPLSQVLSLDSIPLVEQRLSRQIDLRRAINAAIGSTLDDPLLGGVPMKSLDSLGSEELKRVKASIHENSAKAKERSRSLGEAMSKLERFRNSMQSRKRSRSESSVHERQVVMASERPPTASNTAKGAGLPLVTDTMGKPADKNKGVVNKRLRTSMADARMEGRIGNIVVKKTSAFPDREKESPRQASFPVPIVEDKGRPMPIMNNELDKTKLKGRRSAIKADATMSIVSNGTSEADREPKWSGHVRDNRNRPSEGHGLRSGPVHGITSQMNGLVSRGMNKVEIEGPALNSEKGDRILTDKERKNVVKPISQDESLPLNTATASKQKVARAPRSGPVGTSHTARMPSVDVKEKAFLAGKIQATAPANRKRPAPSGSSSPPVAQWVGQQKPTKMARIARRVNLPPPVPAAAGHEETSITPEVLPERDVTTSIPAKPSTVGGVSGLARRVPAPGMSSPMQSKPRSERVSPAPLVSESEESEEAGESKVKEKLKIPAQKMAAPSMPLKNPPIIAKEEAADGIRRQGRTRVLNMPKAAAATVPMEKADVCANAKQLRSARVSAEKPERPGRPNLKKAAVERKPLTRFRKPVGNNNAELSGESDDDHEELGNAVRAAVDANATSCSSDFWKQIEPYFAYVTPEDLAFLRDLMDLKWVNELASTPMLEGAEKSTIHHINGNTESDGAVERNEVRSGGKVGSSGGWFDKVFPLSQRLLAALINEGEIDEGEVFREGSSFNGTESANSRNKDCDADLEGRRVVDRFNDGVLSNGYVNHSMMANEDMNEVDDIVVSSKASSGICDDSYLGCVSNTGSRAGGLVTNQTTWEFQYEQMTLDERILLELQSIGLTVERVPDLAHKDEDEISSEICKLQDDLNMQVSWNRQRVCTLEKAVISRREDEERERERGAVAKLVEIAYKKRGYRSGNSSCGGKGAGAKGSRVAALAFAKRTLIRAHKFEAGESCFSDSCLRDLLFCITPKVLDDNTQPNALVDVEVSTQPASEAVALAPKASAACGQEVPTKLVLRRGADGKEKVEKGSPEVLQNGPTTERIKAKEATWPWAKEKEIVSDEPPCSASMRDVSCIGNAGFGGVKGKRSERERECKAQIKESTKKNEGDRGPRQGVGTIKGERKNKTKPRQKTAPLFKDVNGIIDKTAEMPRGKPFALKTPDAIEIPSIRDEETAAHTPISNQLTVPTEGALDLLPLPDDLVPGEHLGWLDLHDETLQDPQGEYLMGLDIPMDDLSELGMMM